MTRIARWFLDITLDSETLRWWSGNGSVTFGGNTYTGLGTRWKTPDSLKRKASLKSETISLEFDSSRQSDNSDPLGHLLDQKWRRRQVRLRRMAWDTGETPDDGDVLADERGRVRNLSDELKAGEPAKLTMEIESGALAYLERRMETRSSASQKRVFAGDLGFDLVAQLEGVTLAWRTKHKKAGTVQVQLMDEYKPEPRKLALGRFATSGSFVGAFTTGQQNKNLIRVYAIADHRINKLDKVWINGDLVRDAALTHGERTLVRLQGDKGEDRCWVTFYDGRADQTADSYLVSEATNWTTNHRLRGVAYVIVEHLWDSDLPENFDYRFGGEGARLYDRRQDSTAGGTGTQRWDDPDTWVYTTNAMVAADHYRSGIRIMSGSTDFWFGVGEDRDAVPYAEFEALADHCDENVALKAGGTQKRYEVNGILSADQSHDKNLQRLADQMAARVIDQGGRVAFRPPIIRTPVVTLTDDDLVRGSTTKIDPAGRIDDMVNTIDGQFINPANDYKKDDVPAVQIASYVTDDNGEIRDTRNLDLENSGERGQRIYKLLIEDSRRILEQEETYGTKAKAIEPGKWFVRESVIRGFPSGKTFIADEVERFIDGSVTIKASEVYPDELVWDESTAVDLSVPPALPPLSLPDIDPPDVVVTPIDVGDDGGSVIFPGVGIGLDYGALDVGVYTEIQIWRDDGAGDPDAAYQPIVRTVGAGQTQLQIAGELMPSVDYLLRARAIIEGVAGSWSSWYAFTATEDFVVPAGLTDLTGLVDVAAFAAGIEPVSIVDTLPEPVGYEGPSIVFLTTDLQLYRYDDSSSPGWTRSVLSGDIEGLLTDDQIDSIAAAKLTGTITSTQIGSNAITTPKIAAGAITASEIAANAVTVGKIAANAIVSNNIQAGAITSTLLASDSVIAGKVAAGAISTDELAANAVNASKLAANSVIAGKIAAGAVSAANISVANLSAINANLGAITGGSLSINGKFIVDSSGNCTIRSGTSGQRLDITNSLIRLYDASNTLRMRIGMW